MQCLRCASRVVLVGGTRIANRVNEHFRLGTPHGLLVVAGGALESVQVDRKDAAGAGPSPSLHRRRGESGRQNRLITLEPGIMRVTGHATRQVLGRACVVSTILFGKAPGSFITLEPINMRVAGHATRQVLGRARVVSSALFGYAHSRLIALEPRSMRVTGHATRQVLGRAPSSLVDSLFALGQITMRTAGHATRQVRGCAILTVVNPLTVSVAVPASDLGRRLIRESTWRKRWRRQLRFKNGKAVDTERGRVGNGNRDGVGVRIAVVVGVGRVVVGRATSQTFG